MANTHHHGIKPTFQQLPFIYRESEKGAIRKTVIFFYRFRPSKQRDVTVRPEVYIPDPSFMRGRPCDNSITDETQTEYSSEVQPTPQIPNNSRYPVWYKHNHIIRGYRYPPIFANELCLKPWRAVHCFIIDSEKELMLWYIHTWGPAD